MFAQQFTAIYSLSHKSKQVKYEMNCTGLEKQEKLKSLTLRCSPCCVKVRYIFGTPGKPDAISGSPKVTLYQDIDNKHGFKTK